MKNIFYIIIIAITTIALGSCYTTQVYSDKAQGVDFNQFSTYAWLPVNDTVSGSLYYNDIVQQNLMNQVNEEMQARNLSLDTTNPDLLVLFHLRFDQEVENVVRSYPLYNTYPYFYQGFTPLYWGRDAYFYPYYNNIGTVYATEVETIEYTLGTLVVDIIRNSDDKLIWRGWSKERINPNTTSSELEKIISEIFSKFPVEEQKELSSVKK